MGALKPTAWFLLIGGIIGLLFIIVTPPFKGWDEREHFYRAYQVSELTLRAQPVVAQTVTNLDSSISKGYGGTLPLHLTQMTQTLHLNEGEKGVYNYSLIVHYFSESPVYAPKQVVRFDNTAIYSPVGYIPQSIGINVAKLFSGSFVSGFYLARLAGLVVWLALLYVAIRIIPIGKKLFLALALNPVSIFLASTLSPDALATGMIAVLIAIAVKLIHENNKASFKTIVLIATLSLAIVLIKNVYIIVPLIILAVPRQYLGYKIKATIILVSVVVCLLWNVSIVHVTETIPSYFNVTEVIDSHQQIGLAIHNPLSFVSTMLLNIFGTNSIVINHTYAGIFDRNPVPDWVVFVWILTTAALIFANNEGLPSFTKHTRRRLTQVFIAVSAVLVLAIIASLYIGWTPVGSKTIIGVQGRYFIPITFLLAVPLLLYAKPVITKIRTQRVLLYIVLPIGLFTTVLTILIRYTGGV
ncbi:MAG: hypothetical protein JWO99_847 [Candidatus Saccharibacteria bacterium]|nr:hypothetical protein [Candidatus Saccharibacteria bacterium]